MQPNRYDETLKQFRELPNNWDSYNGRPVTTIACETFRALITFIPDSLPNGTITPTTGGGIQLEWHTDSIIIELEINYNGEWFGYAKVPTNLASIAAENDGLHFDTYGDGDSYEYFWNNQDFEKFVNFLKSVLEE